MSAVRRAFLTVALGAAVVSGPIVVSGPAVASPAMAAGDYRNLAAVLTGGQEVPGPGDPDGWGLASVRVWPKSGKVCYALFVRRIGTSTAAHIHVGKRGVAGAPEVHLTAPKRGWAAGCDEVTPALAASIAGSPREYYVNVHTNEFPGGAVRGQLRGVRR